MEAICNIRLYLGGYNSWGPMDWRKSSIYWDKKWEMGIKSFTNITIENFNENLCMTLTLTLPVPVHRQLNYFLSYQLDNGMATSQVRKVGMHVFKINCLTSKLNAWISWSELTLSKISLFYFIYFPSLNSKQNKLLKTTSSFTRRLFDWANLKITGVRLCGLQIISPSTLFIWSAIQNRLSPLKITLLWTVVSVGASWKQGTT